MRKGFLAYKKDEEPVIAPRLPPEQNFSQRQLKHRQAESMPGRSKTTVMGGRREISQFLGPKNFTGEEKQQAPELALASHLRLPSCPRVQLAVAAPGTKPCVEGLTLLAEINPTRNTVCPCTPANLPSGPTTIARLKY